MPARLISIPFLLLTALFVYLTLEQDESFSVYIAISVVFLAVIYTLSPQINWWYYRRRPPELDATIRSLLTQHFGFYNQLTVAEKQRFRQRMALYLMAVEFIPKGWERLPEDIKAVVAANAVWITFYQADYLLPKFEKIVVYTTPFPSPNYRETIHASETFEEDGVLLFSAPQLMAAFIQPELHYNIVLHEYVKVYRLHYPMTSYPSEAEVSWTTLEQISGFNREAIETTVGLPPLHSATVSGVLYFTHGEQMQQTAPRLYERWSTVFNTTKIELSAP